MSKLLSLGFYLIVGALSALSAEYAQKSRCKRLLLIPILLLSLVAGFRSAGVGVDTATYIKLFYFTNSLNFSNVTKEHLFYYIGVFLLRLSGKTCVIFLVFALLISALVLLRLWDFRASASLGVAVFLFVLYYFGGAMNGLRQYIAVAIIFYATRYLEKQRYFSFFVLVLVSVSFHNSAILACAFPLLYILPRREYTVKQSAVLWAAFVSIPACAVYLLLNYSGYYEDAEEFNFGFMSVVRLGILVAVYVLLRGNVRKSADLPGGDSVGLESFAFVFGIALLGYLLGFSSMSISYASRVGYYFRIFDLIFYGRIFRSPQISPSLRLAVFLVLLVLGMYSLWTYNGILPYGISFA